MFLLKVRCKVSHPHERTNKSGHAGAMTM